MSLRGRADGLGHLPFCCSGGFADGRGGQGHLLERQVLDAFLKFRVTLFRIDGGGVQVLVAKDLSKPRQIVVALIEIAAGKSVPQRVGRVSEATDRLILLADRPEAILGQRSTLTDEYTICWDRRPNRQVLVEQSSRFSR